jgi:hypothetical protein
MHAAGAGCCHKLWLPVSFPCVTGTHNISVPEFVGLVGHCKDRPATHSQRVCRNGKSCYRAKLCWTQDSLP